MQKRISQKVVFVRFKLRSPRKAVHRARLAHNTATMANTHEPRSQPMSVA